MKRYFFMEWISYPDNINLSDFSICQISFLFTRLLFLFHFPYLSFSTHKKKIIYDFSFYIKRSAIKISKGH